MHSVAFGVSCDEAIQCLCAEGVVCGWVARGSAPGGGDFGFWLVVDFGALGIGLH